MKIRELTQQIETFAPLCYQESYDNSGIQVGDVSQEVKGVLLCIDITEEVLDEAIQKGCNLIVSHHPLLFNGLKKITPTGDYIARCVIKAIQHEIALYSCHTNMDKAPNGVSWRMAEKLGVQIEKALIEEKDGSGFGLGVIGNLSETKEVGKFLEEVKAITKIGTIRHTAIDLHKEIKRVALCGGSGFEFLTDAMKQGADIYLTADIKYHQFFAPENRIILADFGHFESEQFTKEIFYEILSKNNTKFALYFSDSKTNPINYL